MEFNKTITIACPISNREDYLPYYLWNIIKQTYPKNLINIFFVTNNIKDNSIKILKNFKTKYKNEYNEIRLDNIDNNTVLDDTGNNRAVRNINNNVYTFLATLRNYITKYTNTDYLFSVDSDIMILPDTLEKLYNWDKDVISALVCNGHVFASYYPNKNIDKYKYTNVLKKNPMNLYMHFRKSELKGLIEVDATGAVYLLKKEVYKHCKYKADKQGEDIPFCKDVQKLKKKLYCDTSIKLPHCMTLDLLEEYKKGTFKY